MRTHWDAQFYLCPKATTINPESMTEAEPRGADVIPAINYNDVRDEKNPTFTCVLLCSRDLMTFSDLHSHCSTDGPDLPLQRAHACLPCVPTNTHSHTNHSVITAGTAGPGHVLIAF